MPAEIVGVINITFNPNIHVAQAGLNFLTLFNEECHIEARQKFI